MSACAKCGGPGGKPCETCDALGKPMDLCDRCDRELHRRIRTALGSAAAGA